MTGETGECRTCGLILSARKNRRRARYCSQECRTKHLALRYRANNPEPTISSGTRGAISELVVCADLMSRGFEVFRALSPHTSCDLAVLLGGRLVRVEVRTGTRGLDGTLHYPTKGSDKGRQDLWAIVDKRTHQIEYSPPIGSVVS